MDRLAESAGWRPKWPPARNPSVTCRFHLTVLPVAPFVCALCPAPPVSTHPPFRLPCRNDTQFPALKPKALSQAAPGPNGSTLVRETVHLTVLVRLRATNPARSLLARLSRHFDCCVTLVGPVGGPGVFGATPRLPAWCRLHPLERMISAARIQKLPPTRPKARCPVRLRLTAVLLAGA